MCAWFRLSFAGTDRIWLPGLWVTFKPVRALLKPSWNLSNTHQRQSLFIKLFNEFRWVKRYYNCCHVEHTEDLLKLQHLKHSPSGMRNICRALIISLKTFSRQRSTDGSAAGKAWQPPFNPGTCRKVKREGTPQRWPLTSAHAYQFLCRHTSNNFEKQIQNNLILSSWILPFSFKFYFPKLYTNRRHFLFKRLLFLYIRLLWPHRIRRDGMECFLFLVTLRCCLCFSSHGIVHLTPWTHYVFPKWS